jgi:magnesium-transporting ATPase (P-type)
MIGATVSWILAILPFLMGGYVVYTVWNSDKMKRSSKIWWTVFAIIFNVLTFIVFLIKNPVK